MTIGQRIRKKRDDLNMRMTELADRAHISKQLLYKYENDIVTNIPSDKIEAIADALFTTPASLMGWEDVNFDPVSGYPIYKDDDDVITVDLKDAPFPSQEEINKAWNFYKRVMSLPPEMQVALQTILDNSQKEP